MEFYRLHNLLSCSEGNVVEIPCGQGIIKDLMVRYCSVYLIKIQWEIDHGNKLMLK